MAYPHNSRSASAEKDMPYSMLRLGTSETYTPNIIKKSITLNAIATIFLCRILCLWHHRSGRLLATKPIASNWYTPIRKDGKLKTGVEIEGYFDSGAKQMRNSSRIERIRRSFIGSSILDLRKNSVVEYTV